MSYRTVTCVLEGVSPYSQRRYHNTPKEGKETHEEYERRTWREALHVDENGIVYIPAAAVKYCLDEAARFLGHKIPGRRGAQYTSHFERGVLVTEHIPLGVHKQDVEGVWLHVPADGKRGGTTRVERCFGRIPDWKARVTFFVFDEAITNDVFEEHLKQAGQFVGLGFWRPEKRGQWGRFAVKDIKWQTHTQ